MRIGSESLLNGAPDAAEFENLHNNNNNDDDDASTPPLLLPLRCLVGSHLKFDCISVLTAYQLHLLRPWGEEGIPASMAALDQTKHGPDQARTEVPRSGVRRLDLTAGYSAA